MLVSLIGSMLGVLSGAGIAIFQSWYSFRKYGTSNYLGVSIVLCRKSKYFRWLTWNIWGDDTWFYDRLQKQIEEYRAYRKEVSP